VLEDDGQAIPLAHRAHDDGRRRAVNLREIAKAWNVEHLSSSAGSAGQVNFRGVVALPTSRVALAHHRERQIAAIILVAVLVVFVSRPVR